MYRSRFNIERWPLVTCQTMQWLANCNSFMITASPWQMSFLNTYSETVIFCFSARNEETYSSRLFEGKRRETKQTRNELLTVYVHMTVFMSSTKKDHTRQPIQLCCHWKDPRTWCKTEQFWQFPTVASAAIATFLDWLSPGIMVRQVQNTPVVILCG